MDMEKNHDTLTDNAELRRRAEALIKTKNRRKNIVPDTDDGRLLHELQIHQVELEMQNEELRDAHARTEAALARYTRFYNSP